MIRFIPYVLVCMAGQDPRECTRYTALDVFNAEPAKNEVMCNFYAQAAAAGTQMGRDPRGTYIKTVCERVKDK